MFQLPRCSTYKWALTQGTTAPDNLAYATEHIYELQLIALFLRWLSTNNASLKAYLAVNNRNICANFINQILFGQGQQWTVLTFGAGGNIKTPGRFVFPKPIIPLFNPTESPEHCLGIPVLPLKA